ncbi:SGNH/GDSL hydrolase family protein [Streptomyces sp. NPDC059740]|uniref:SGNH/GDSL hydrolase family protein n=1 Tax=Streptomyces sp. NPDC059740 TaxID=3346926 RepID=UPI0036527717
MTVAQQPSRHHPKGGRVSSLLAAVTLALALTVSACGDGAAHGPSRPRASASHSSASAWDTTPSSLAALGDSITVGFDACTVLSDCPEVSWATGTDRHVDSLAQRLLGGSGKSAADRSWNFARTGAVVADLPAQVDAAVAHRPQLVTVLIGANDACRPRARQMTPADTFRDTFHSALAKLRRALPHTQVYVAGVPDLLRLWQQGRGNPLGKEVWKLGICQSMLHSPDDMSHGAAKRRQSVEERVVAYNTALREECRADRLCRFDPSVFRYRFTGRELSQWDWFHPSKYGQRQLAALAYRTITRRD